MCDAERPWRLRDVSIGQCGSLRNVVAGPKCRAIRLSQCDALCDVVLGATCTHLVLTHCSSLTSIDTRSNCLESATISHCDALTSFDVSFCSALTDLTINWCRNLRELAPVSTLLRLNLGKVDALGGIDLMDFPSLGDLTLHKTLYKIKGGLCGLVGVNLRRLTVYPDAFAATGPVSLDLTRCPELVELVIASVAWSSGVVVSPSLRRLAIRGEVDTLDISRCRAIETLNVANGARVVFRASEERVPV